MITHALAFVSGAVALLLVDRYLPKTAAAIGEVVDYIFTKIEGIFKKKA